MQLSTEATDLSETFFGDFTNQPRDIVKHGEQGS